MGFDGELFVEELRNDLQASGRTLDQADWVKRTQQGEATKEDLVAWARQHYHGVTYHTRRILAGWVTRIPYEMTDGVIDNLAEEVLGTTSKSGLGTCTGCSSSRGRSVRPTRSSPRRRPTWTRWPAVRSCTRWRCSSRGTS